MSKLKRQSSLLQNHGQSTVEYVLMLVVSVAMVGALAYQIFRPMREFLKDYMGLYIACLLETGELPSLGNTQTQQVLQDEGCNAKFKTATLANGRPPSAPGSSRSGESGKKPESNSNSNGASSSTAGGGGASQASGRNLLTRSGKGGASDGPQAPSGKVTEIPIENAASKFYNRKTNTGYENEFSSRKTSGLDMSFSEDEKKKQKRKETARTAVNLEDGAVALPKKINVTPPERNLAADDGDEGFTIGNFLKFLLIAAIVIALVMVLGSQALKIIKSQEK